MTNALELSSEEPIRLSYHLGIYLAVNAMPNTYAVIDGPDCVFRKAEWVHGRHDLRSSLLDVMGTHRVVSTLMNAENVIREDGSALATRLRQVCAQPDAHAAFVCSMPHVMLIGTQYDRVLRSVQPTVSTVLYELPGRSLEADWLHGYEEVLYAVAQRMDFSSCVRRPNTVAIVGYLMDRTEEDHTANLREMKRLVASLGLELVSVWLSNTAYSSLAEVGCAETIIAWPLGKRAAHWIARQTGANVIDAVVPMGAGATARWLRQLATATDRVGRVKQVLEHEQSRVARALEWMVAHALLDTRVGYIGSPELFFGLAQMASEYGMDLALLAATSDDTFVGTSPVHEFDVPALMYNPGQQELARAIDEAGPMDVLIADSRFSVHNTPRVRACLEFGFPSHFDHALFERPYLGFAGALCFLDRVARVVMQSRKR